MVPKNPLRRQKDGGKRRLSSDEEKLSKLISRTYGEEFGRFTRTMIEETNWDGYSEDHRSDAYSSATGNLIDLYHHKDFREMLTNSALVSFAAKLPTSEIKLLAIESISRMAWGVADIEGEPTAGVFIEGIIQKLSQLSANILLFNETLKVLNRIDVMLVDVHDTASTNLLRISQTIADAFIADPTGKASYDAIREINKEIEY